jgi:hypothetical protein
MGNTFSTTPASSASVDGFWTTQAIVEQIYGVENCAEDVDLNNDGTGTAAVWQRALDTTDARMDVSIATVGLSRPVVFTGAAFRFAQRVASAQVRRDIHRARGVQETNAQGGPNTGGVYEKEAADLWGEWLELLERGGTDFPAIDSDSGGEGNAPAVLRPTEDEYGRAVGVAAGGSSYLGPYWDEQLGGYRW